MEKLKVGAWGNSSGIRLSKSMIAALNIKDGDILEASIKGNKVILANPHEELTFEELFKDYKGESIKSKLQEFDPAGNEKW